MLKEGRTKMINKKSPEKYHLSRTGVESWRKCQYMVSFLSTEKDIKLRTGVALDTYKTPETIFNSKHMSEVLKLRLFKTYIQIIFLCNSKLWTITKTLENMIHFEESF